MRFSWALLLLSMWLGYAGSIVLRASDPATLKKVRLNVVASESMLTTVNPQDAIASMGIWVNKLGISRGYECESKIEITVSLGQIRQKLREHAVDLLVLDTPDYLTLGDEGLVQAVAVGTNGGQVAAFPYLLLTNGASGSDELAGLRGKRIIVASRTKSNMGLVWLETLLAESRLGRVATFFGSMETTYRGSSCVLPLFFGKIDACVVDSQTWEAVKELNPQLGRLRVVARSDALLEGLLAMPVQPQSVYQSDVIDALLNLHKTVAGGQLGVVFKAGPQVRAEKAQFESERALCSKYRRMVDPSGDFPGATVRRPAVATGKERY